MRRRLTNLARRWAILAVLAALGLSGRPAFGQAVLQAPMCPPCPYPTQPRTMPGTTVPPGTPSTETPSTPEATPGTGTTPPSGLAAFSGEAGGAVGGETTALQLPNAGYIDSAIPFTNFRLRYDSAYGDNAPDRAEYFYPKCGCFRVAGIDPNAPGPPKQETNVNYQDIRSYLEVAFNRRFSMFAELPYRFLNPDQNDNVSGIGDMNAGFKAALLYEKGRVITFQLRTYIPTGNAGVGLGTNHVSIEPSLLIYQKLSDRLLFEGQLGDWIPVGGTEFAGNIIDYGFGLSYFVVNNPNFRVAPVAEMLGWTVLSGKESFPVGDGVRNAAGDTIVNGKLGIRFGFGQATQPGYISGSSLFIGYSRALTGDVWYRNMLRVEYRVRF